MRMTRIGHTTHPLTRSGRDLGRAAADLPMERIQMQLSSSPEQEAELEQLLAGQHDAASPHFQEWLTPEQFGERFGPAQQDIGSRYCETDRLSNTAWSLFGQVPKGWPLVQAICDYVHDRITFGYQHASPFKSAWDAYNERRGVCRDFAHLAVTLCRCMNIPARYCTGYLGDMGAPPPYDP